MSQKSVVKLGRIFVAERWCIAFVMLALCFVAQAQQNKSVPAKASLTGRYEGSAQNKAEEVITVAIDLTEKEGVLLRSLRRSAARTDPPVQIRQGENFGVAPQRPAGAGAAARRGFRRR